MRILLSGAIGAILLAILAGLARFVQWRSRARRRLFSAGTLVQTARGPIECVIAGPEDARAVLVLHGGLGGWDQGIAIAEDLSLTKHFRVIAPSRPGYLRTPLAVAKTTNEAGDAMIALLDALGITKAAVVGLSGGGPTAVAMATHHPQRVGALVMICAISHRHVQPAITTESLFGRLVFSNAGEWLLDLMCWLTLQLAWIAPAFMTRRILRMTELAHRSEIRTRVRELGKHPERMRWLSRLLDHSFPISPRKVGLNNDLVQFASLTDRIDGRIICPALVVHGRIDGNVPVAHAEAVLTAAPHAEALIVDDASHLLWLHPRIGEVRCQLLQFLNAGQ